MIFLGIDPGTSGAIVRMAFDGTRFEIRWAAPFPRHMVKTKEQLDLGELHRRIANYCDLPATTAYVEKVGAMPGQGTSSMFSFGRAVGMVEALLVAHCYVIEYVAPAWWKKRYGLGDDKKESLAAACRLWPADAHLFRSVRGERTQAEAIAIAEAALIGRAGAERELARIGKNFSEPVLQDAASSVG